MPGVIQAPLPATPPRGRLLLLGTAIHQRRQCRDRMPNWSQHEVSALISTKRELYMEELDMPDSHDLMTTDVNKWLGVSMLVMDSGFSPCMRDASSCKTKWHQILPNYKRIANYHSRTGTNTSDYWEQAPAERVAGGCLGPLRKSFSISCMSVIGVGLTSHLRM
jgi:hypothetical protein